MAGISEKILTSIACHISPIFSIQEDDLVLSTLALGMILFALFFGLVAACERL